MRDVKINTEERSDNREGTPVAHDDDALIVFGGKTYPVNKKIASENGEGELVEESIPRSAATANGTTNNAVTNVTAGSDNKGGVSSDANVETNSPSESISQGRQNSKAKFSMDTSTDSERSFFGKAWDKFAKALHLKGDKIVTVEEQKKAQRQAQEKAMEAYLKEPTKENRKQFEKLKVTKGQLEAYKNGEEYDDEISLRQYTVASPSRIADKVAVFRAFYRMGERAMDKLVRLRSKYERKYNEVMSIVTKQEERENLFELLWKGDADQVEYGTLTENELAEIKAANPNDTTKAIQRAKIEKICKEQNVSENVARAYLQTWRLITSAYHMINEARRHPQTLTKYLSDSAIDELKANKFVNVMHVSEDKDSSGRRRVTYKEYQHATLVLRHAGEFGAA